MHVPGRQQLACTIAQVRPTLARRHVFLLPVTTSDFMYYEHLGMSRHGSLQCMITGYRHRRFRPKTISKEKKKEEKGGKKIKAPIPGLTGQTVRSCVLQDTTQTSDVPQSQVAFQTWNVGMQSSKPSQCRVHTYHEKYSLTKPFTRKRPHCPVEPLVNYPRRVSGGFKIERYRRFYSPPYEQVSNHEARRRSWVPVFSARAGKFPASFHTDPATAAHRHNFRR